MDTLPLDVQNCIISLLGEYDLKIIKNKLKHNADEAKVFAKLGYLNMLKSAYEHMIAIRGYNYDNFMTDRTLVTIAIEHGYLDMLQWAQSIKCDIGSDDCSRAVFNGHIHIVEWLVANKYKWNRSVCLFAIRAGHLDILQYLIANKFEYEIKLCIRAAKYQYADTMDNKHDNEQLIARYAAILAWLDQLQ